MDVKEWLNKVSYIKELDLSNGTGDKDFICDSYFSNFDDSYITHVGVEDSVKHLADLEITDELTHGVGFSPKEGKWYGWSHRAIYGFKIGSTCSIGDCHYIGSSLEDQEKDAVRFWSDDSHIGTGSRGVIEEDGEKYFDIFWTYDNKIPNEKLRSTVGGCRHHIKPLGKGEWTAKTMEDARQMAIDFKQGVS